MATWLQAAEAVCETVHSIFTDACLPLTQVSIGWPPASIIDSLFKVPSTPTKALINIYPFGPSRNTTRYIKDYDKPTVTLSALTLTLTSNSVTLSGTITPGENFYCYINYVPYYVTVLVNDTYNSLLTRMAQKINALPLGITATVNSATLTLTPTTAIFDFKARAYGNATIYREVLRIQRQIQLNVWTANILDRQNLTDAILLALSRQSFLTFEDKSKGRILYETDSPNDAELSAGIARHFILYSIEYAMYDVEIVPLVGAVEGTIQVQNNLLSSYDDALVTYITHSNT